MNEKELRDTIKKELKIKQKALKSMNYTLSESFIRGYITGTELTGVKIPSHWYDEIIKEIIGADRK